MAPERLFKINAIVIDHAPRVMRGGGLGLAAAAYVDGMFVLTGVFFGVSAGAWLVMRRRKGAKGDTAR